MKTHIMPDSQKEQIQEMDSGEIMDFQIRLQIECDMTDQDAANYIAQAFECEED